ncbi:hypothetical protein PSACC_01194 [Paramicrosporidium saccamoebae]|uniref:Uncharacterized protein n=1 Tax=Paramicrosporidium saccamoebae TaxID=1246581 RepID=A0A2H9TMM2_9FUNG|nr:hypothetical protein PSACC_01194 [Paramicrosporidium saccamoebae]
MIIQSIIRFLIVTQLCGTVIPSAVNCSVHPVGVIEEFNKVYEQCKEAPSVRCLSQLEPFHDVFAGEQPETLQTLAETFLLLDDNDDMVLKSAKRWVCFSVVERHLAGGAEFTVDDFEILLNATGTDQSVLNMVMRIMSSSVGQLLVRQIQISGNQFVSLSMNLQSRLVGQFSSVIQSAVLKDWIMSIVVFLGQERLLSALLVEYLERGEEDGTFMDALIIAVLQLQFSCDKGDWRNSGPFARFYRVLVEDAADFLVNFGGTLPPNMSGAVAMMFLNRSLLNTTSPNLESNPILGLKLLQSPKEAFTILDFYLTMTNFGPYLFDAAADFAQRRSRVVSLINDVAEDLLCEENGLAEGASSEAIRMYALKRSLEENSYRLVHLLLTDPTENGLVLSTEKIGSLIWGCDHCALAVTQLLTFAANGEIEVPENANSDVLAIVQLFAMVQTRTPPCDSSEVVKAPSLLASKSNPAVFRAYLLFSFGITLRHSVSLGTAKQSPAAILKAANAIITDFCQNRLRSGKNITLITS